MGKLAAMVAHAAMTFLIARAKPQQDSIAEGLELIRLGLTVRPDEHRWLTELDPGMEETGQVSMAKIVCAVNAHNKAGAFVCIAIGPDWPEKLDPVTGQLKVYR